MILAFGFIAYASNYIGLFRMLLGSVLFLPEFHIKDFNYSTAHGEFRMWEDEMKGPHIRDIDIIFKSFRECYPTSPDTIVYRNFRRNIWEFWNWGNFFTHERYKLPYLSPDDIKSMKKKTAPFGDCAIPNYAEEVK
ncbi:hypothetical protein [Emticicia fluvialis]|uniref:hypothetical protein n=1 Tax=Emticicia fluvialis TaxID=2974474 RepID=UPI0021669547|nr:hypothetical protein [Emticicia fluvialis]